MHPEIPLAALPDPPRKRLERKAGWPDWPFFWMDERSMDSLKDIASRLKDKMESAYRNSGVIGETTPVEKQILNIIGGLQQQVGELHDAFQASLQIIDDNRPSQRVSRALRAVRRAGQRSVTAIRNSTALTVVGAVSTLAFIFTGLLYLYRHLHR